MSIEFRSELSDDKAVVYCTGQLKAGDETDKLRQIVTDFLFQRPKVVLDLAQIQYMDSSALSILVGLYSSARTAHGEIRYQNLTTQVKYVKPPKFQAAA
jgi:anti-sigma B factor antagonist